MPNQLRIFHLPERGSYGGDLVNTDDVPRSGQAIGTPNSQPAIRGSCLEGLVTLFACPP